MKEIKLNSLLLLIIFCFSTAIFAREIDDFEYDGLETNHSVFLSHVEQDSSGNYHQIKTEAKLLFDGASKNLGNGVNIQVNMNGADIGMSASSNTNKLTLLKLKTSDRWFTENTLNVLMTIDVRFVDNLNGIVRPLRNSIKDLNVLDDFVSFTAGKIVDTKNLNAVVQIYRKKTLGKDDLVFEKTLSDSEFVVTDYGSDQSLITLDLNQQIAKLERGKKHIVKVYLVSNFGKWRPFTESQAELFKPSETISVESDFRYSK